MWSLVGAVVLGTLIEHAVEELVTWCRAQIRKTFQEKTDVHPTTA
jgi:hypothetical protein